MGSERHPSVVRKYRKEHPWCEYRLPSGVLCSAMAVHVHHKRHKSLGGKDELENLESLCLVHHMARHGIKAV